MWFHLSFICSTRLNFQVKCAVNWWFAHVSCDFLRVCSWSLSYGCPSWITWSNTPRPLSFNLLAYLIIELALLTLQCKIALKAQACWAFNHNFRVLSTCSYVNKNGAKCSKHGAKCAKNGSKCARSVPSVLKVCQKCAKNGTKCQKLCQVY